MDRASIDLSDTLVCTINTLAVHNIAHCVVDIIHFWQLKAEQACRLLGGIPSALWLPLSTKDPKARFSVHPDVFQRMELILGIHQFLNILVPNQVQIDWINRPHEAFQGHAPIDAMSLEDLNGLTFTRNYLFARNAKLMSPFCVEDHEPRL
jgi:hypothetical protein